MALYIGGVAVDATAAEIDVLDGLDRGSIIYGIASSASTVLGQGNADEVLTSDGTDIAWAAAGGASFAGIDDQTSSNDDQLTITDTEVVINEDHDDLDFRVESDTDTHALFVQGSDGNVGIGTDSPNDKLHIVGSDGVVAGESYSSQAEIILENAGVGLLEFMGDTDDYHGLAFSDTATSTRGALVYDHGTGLGGGADTMYFQTAGAIRAAIDSSGNVGIGTTTPDAPISIYKAAGVQIHLLSPDTPLMSFETAGGAVDREWQMGVVVADGRFYIRDETVGQNRLGIATDGTFTGAGSNDISDGRLKENVADIENALDVIKQTRGRTFTWKPEANMALGTKYGLIAQELEGILPDLIYNQTGLVGFSESGELLDIDADESEIFEWSKSVNMTGLIPILVEAIKELSAKVEALENE